MIGQSSVYFSFLFLMLLAIMGRIVFNLSGRLTAIFVMSSCSQISAMSVCCCNNCFINVLL